MAFTDCKTSGTNAWDNRLHHGPSEYSPPAQGLLQEETVPETQGQGDIVVSVSSHHSTALKPPAEQTPQDGVFLEYCNEATAVQLPLHDEFTQHEAAAAAGQKKEGLRMIRTLRRQLASCFRLNRWHLLVLFSLHALFVGPHYLNWAPLRQCLHYWGVYEWLCESPAQQQQQQQHAAAAVDMSLMPIESDFVVSPNSIFLSTFLPVSAAPEVTAAAAAAPAAAAVPATAAGVAAAEADGDRRMRASFGSHQAVCEEQEIAIARLFAITTASDFGVSFVGGIFLDCWGPKAASSLGTLSMLLGCLLIAVSSASLSLYILGFVLYGLGIDAAFYGVISLPLLFPKHEGLVMTVLMSFRCLAWGTPVLLERLAAPETLGLSAHVVLLGVQCSALLVALFIALLFLPMKPFQPPPPPAAAVAAATAAAGMPSQQQQAEGTRGNNGCVVQQHSETAAAAVAAAAEAEAAAEADAEAAVTAAAAAAAAAGAPIYPQRLRSLLIPDGVEEQQQQQQQQQEQDTARAAAGLVSRSLRTMSSLSVSGVVEERATSSQCYGDEAAETSPIAAAEPEQQLQQQQAVLRKGPLLSVAEVSPCVSGGGVSPLSGKVRPISWQSRWMNKLHAFYLKGRLFVLDYLFAGSFFPIVPYFALTLLRGVFFGESSEYLVPQAMRGLHILLSLVFIYPPLLGVVADKVGEGFCLVLVNTLGCLLMGLSLLQWYLQSTPLAFIISLCYSAYAPLMSGQVYLYILKNFPQEHLGKLLGLAMTVGGFFSLIATPLFELSVHRNSNFVVVLGILLGTSFLAYGLIWWAVHAANKRRRVTSATSPQST